MKSIITMLLVIFVTNTTINALAAANDFKEKTGITSLNAEILEQSGTAKNAFLDGTVGRQTAAYKVMGGDKKAIAEIQKACVNPNAKIKNTCQLIAEYLS
jgi:hypothetical protein